MAVEQYPIVAREGWIHITLAISIASLVHYALGWPWALPLWFLSLFIIQFFRDPPRSVPDVANAVIAPADGKVVSLVEAEDPYLNRPALKISIFMNVFSVHSNRVPIGGKVMQQWYQHGRFVNAMLDKASHENERNAIWVQDDHGVDVVCVQIAGLIARRIMCYVEPGGAVKQGQRYGFIRFGSRVDVYLPKETVINTRLGAWVYAGKDVIATLAGLDQSHG
ncbi:MAG: phosphatidylserine decarboxylase [Gammaproteobacteria bacterium]|nr:phosphatidylserine decarboxylase [Gammaproteobacteria bacterium]